MSDNAHECYGVVDDGVLLYESLNVTPWRALCAASWEDEDGNNVHARLMAGKIKVHRIRIEIMDEAAVESPKAKEKP